MFNVNFAPYANGHWTTDLPSSFPVTNPATGEFLAEVAATTAELTKQTIAAAHAAFPAWRARTALERADLLLRWHDLILDNQEDLARLLTAEQGKPLSESRGEIAYGASFIRWFAEEGRRAYGDVVPTHAAGKRIVVLKEPVGVVAAITPWNFPNAMIARKVAPALAVGCPVIVKPAEDTPLSALALAELADRAGFPPGVFNVLPTADPAVVGDVLTASPLVRKLSFTGSTAVGRKLMAACAPTLKKLSLELGGNAPFLVFDDADLDAAVAGCVAAKFRNAGQTCVCVNRVYVQNEVYDTFVEKLTAAVSELRVGPGAKDGVAVGPLINAAAVDKVNRLLADATAKGGAVTTGGKFHPAGDLFFAPTVIRNATQEMDLAREEIFGPVAAVFRFADEAEAVRLANATEAGLAAYFYGRDHARLWRVAEALDYGMVGINTGMISTAVAPFGGVKASGFGREGSKYGLEDYLVTKYLCWDIQG